MQPTLLPERCKTLCIMCCHGKLVWVSSAGFETLLALFAVGIKPKCNNIVVRLMGENKGGNMVCGAEHRA